jgi:hypothetical protein
MKKKRECSSRRRSLDIGQNPQVPAKSGVALRYVVRLDGRESHIQLVLVCESGENVGAFE